jgi:putative component of membrane protein insertase Oxa1/YidC/SpoIIIJ protein YidD
MIRSLETHGVVRGGYRGFRRILRCRPPNGGVDEP